MDNKARVTINVSEEVKEWYKQEAKKYSMAMGSMMSYVLTKHYENVSAAETMKDMTKLIKEAKDDGMTVDGNREMMEQFAELMTMMKEET